MKSLSNPNVMKEINTNIIRSTLRMEKKATKQQLAELTGLSIVTVGTILNQLLKRNEVLTLEMIPSNGGRPAQNFGYNEELKHAIIIYVHVCDGIDKIFCKVINLFGKCVYEKTVIMETVDLNSFEPLIDKMIEMFPTVNAIGFGLPGIEHDNIMVINDFEFLHGTAFTQHYKEKYKLSIGMENDANLAVLGYCQIHIKECQNTVVYIYLPQKYEPGVGVSMAGSIYKGRQCFAGEIEKLPIGINWRSLNYSDLESVCNALSKLILSYICILNPDKIVLAGDCITQKYLDTIQYYCIQEIDELAMPRLCMADDFHMDFELGLNKITLDFLVQ